MKFWPDYIFESCKSHSRKPNPERFSVTDLINPPLIRTLNMLYWDDIVQAPTESMNMLEGTMMDSQVKYFCRNGMTNMKMELKMGNTLLVGCQDIYYPPGVVYGWKGKFIYDKWTWMEPLISEGLLVDLKYTSIWNLSKAKNTWIAQLNTYYLMMHRLYPDLPVKKLEIHAVGRDWRWKEKLQFGHDYPDSPFVILDIPMWSVEETEQYIDAQLHDHALHPERECTDDEVWKKQDQIAIMKENRKRAVRVLDSRKEITEYCRENKITIGKNGYYEEKRSGSRIRCEHYCNVNLYCKYYNDSKKIK